MELERCTHFRHPTDERLQQLDIYKSYYCVCGLQYLADPGEEAGGPGPPPYFFGNSAIFFEVSELSSQNSTFIAKRLKAGPLLS